MHQAIREVSVAALGASRHWRSQMIADSRSDGLSTAPFSLIPTPSSTHRRLTDSPASGIARLSAIGRWRAARQENRTRPAVHRSSGADRRSPSALPRPPCRRLVAARNQFRPYASSAPVSSPDHRRMNPKLHRQLRQGLLPAARCHRHSRFELRACAASSLRPRLMPPFACVGFADPAVQKSGAAAVEDDAEVRLIRCA